MIILLNKSRFNIRKCKHEDYGFVYRLSKKNMYALFVRNWGRWEPKRFRDDFDEKNIMIVEYKKRRIAYYDIKLNADSGHINNIQVARFMQGKGLGTFLMGFLEKESKKHGIKRINLKVFKDNPAKELYLRLGYEPIKDDGPAIILEKRL
jgi:GNAT superfamily N-acetyltransferase